MKPGNVLLDEEGNAYLSDFGIALETGAPEQTAGTMIRGTPAYLSPEQIRSSRRRRVRTSTPSASCCTRC